MKFVIVFLLSMIGFMSASQATNVPAVLSCQNKEGFGRNQTVYVTVRDLMGVHDYEYKTELAPTAGPSTVQFYNRYLTACRSRAFTGAIHVRLEFAVELDNKTALIQVLDPATAGHASLGSL